MKKLFSFLLAGTLLCGSSCVTVTPAKKDSGKHKGWFKNRHNPHHPHSDNPGHNKKRFTRPDFQ